MTPLSISDSDALFTDTRNSLALLANPQPLLA